MNNSPKVFVSHATEDKGRFVLEFATNLRSKGIDAWVDQWEIFPGDSLVDKIFEEGIKDAQAMIIVLSKISVQKPWVKEELNAGVVKRISGKCKLIPVVIDDCEVPEALKSTVWEKIKDINNYPQELNRIVSSIFGLSEKPPLGTPPTYTRLTIENFTGMTRIDTVVFKTICEYSLKSGSDWIGISEIQDHLSQLGISEAEMYESMEILESNYFVQGERSISSIGLDLFQITPSGFQTYADVFIKGFQNLANQVLISIVNSDMDSNEKLSSHLNQSTILIDYILDILSVRGLIKTIKSINGNTSIYEVTAAGKRATRNTN